jgi:hypothetical protein
LTRSIAQAAAETSYFERTRIHHSAAEIRLSETMAQLPGVSFEAVGVTTTVRSYTIKDVVLDADTGLMFQDQHVIPETTYFVPEGADLTRPRNNLVRLDDSEDYIIGFNQAHKAYQHWLTQCVPAIDWALRQKRSRPVRLVLPPLTPWQEDFLDILRYRHLPRLTLKPGTFYFIPHVEYSEFLNGRTSFRVCLSNRDTARRILDFLPSDRPSHRVLVVPCSNPYYGRIRNEEEVLDLLRRRGAYVVGDRLTTAERLNLFRHADVVIGPLGQGLADIVFCNPGTLLWEWMPQHHQNASINRLAQAAELDYWGDAFQSDSASDGSDEWNVDVETVARRFDEISQRLAVRKPQSASPRLLSLNTHNTHSPPLDELLLAFESLGDNCEFGLVQRHAGIEPLGLLRFAGMSLSKLVAALEARFEGIGTADTVKVCPAGEPGRRELMIHETWLDTRYHTWILEGEIDPEELREREAKRLTFLRRKILADLAVGEKIWVWREWGETDSARLQPLLAALRALGPNILFWVVAADEHHQPGTVERLDRDFIKGYVERLASYDNAAHIRATSWFHSCENAYNLCHPERADPERPTISEIAPVPMREDNSMATYGYFLDKSQRPGWGRTPGWEPKTIEFSARALGLQLDRIFLESDEAGQLELEDRPQGQAILASLKAGDMVITPCWNSMFRTTQPTNRNFFSILHARGIGLYITEFNCNLTGPAFGCDAKGSAPLRMGSLRA